VRLRYKFCYFLNNFDLHNHSTASDGLLAPADVVALAARNGCDAFALTDHDTVDAVAEAQAAADAIGLRFIAGVEISVSWAPNIDAKSVTLHIVGLGIDASNPALGGGLQGIRAGRTSRAKLIGDDLARVGIEGMFEAAYALAANRDMIGRTHFARALVNAGRVNEVGIAFQRYLTPGRPGYVPHQWASLADAVAWIRAAGGVAVIAHPGRYRIDKAEARQLFDEFKSLGGTAIEVVTGSHTPKQYREYALLAKEFGFLASRGADYHGPGESQFQPGKLPLLPDGLSPVWTMLE
jgi:3',5'-nucleoside bisphosphate phosphatase